MPRYERPRCALMVDDVNAIVAVALDCVDEKKAMGWFLVASEADLLPFNPPKLILEQADGYAGED